MYILQVFWDMKFEKLLVMGWCLEVGHLVMMWLSLTGPQYPRLNDLLSPGTLWNYIVLCLSVKSSLKQEWKLLPVREWYTWKRLRKCFEILGRRIRGNLRTMPWTSSQYFSLWSQGKGTLKTIRKSIQVREKSSSDGEKTLEEMARKKWDCARNTILPTRGTICTGAVMQTSIPAHNLPIFAISAYHHGFPGGSSQ